MNIEPKIQHGHLQDIKLYLSSVEFLTIKDALVKYSQTSNADEMNKLMAWRMVEQFENGIEKWKEEYLKGETKMNTVPTIKNKEELNNILVEYRKNWEELEKRKAANEPSVDHWRLSVTIQDTEKAILDYLRHNDL
jgi:hypothetical protein